MRLAIVLLCAAATLSSCASQQTPAPLGSSSQSATAVYVGQKFPEVTLTNFHTEESTSSRDLIRGKVINLWASWCEPCRREFPLMAQSQLAQKIVAINVNDLSQSNSGQAQANEMVASGKNSFGVWIDSQNVLPKKLAVVGLPITLAVDRTGVIVDAQIGELHQDSLDRLLKAVGE